MKRARRRCQSIPTSPISPEERRTWPYRLNHWMSLSLRATAIEKSTPQQRQSQLTNEDYPLVEPTTTPLARALQMTQATMARNIPVVPNDEEDEDLLEALLVEKGVP